ncbi:aminoglycoside phosphotransferase [Rhodosalinus halophilus]|uniref:Aminoglycoside phosphotransferase n=1 Tax=Rhodosalinus halophilus TaxID=2259333 RepID=A0A365U837_9RHOB|nr:phosphotransferase [Rhodosalinus halophilus]RBI84709.1 aminoglycoside phosphotransferase [Rhodosalinus halophilus]
MTPPEDPREARRADFLAAAGWGGVEAVPLAGDASARRYFRLQRADGARAVLMEAEAGEEVSRFLRVGRFLRDAGLSAPEVVASDAPNGLLLLEDFGDALVARIAEAEPEREAGLYAVAAEALAALHRHAPPADWPRATPAMLSRAIAPLFEHYAPETPPETRAATEEALAQALEGLDAPTAVPILRDFHAENLIWLPERAGSARAGLLDYQDAMAGHVAYDLASLLRDARRDVSPAAAEAAITAFLRESGRNRATLTAAMALLGVQRNLRILGVFARLAAHGKPRYLALMPRVWRHLEADLAHPAAAPVARALGEALPAPDPARLDRLRRRCPTP